MNGEAPPFFPVEDDDPGGVNLPAVLLSLGGAMLVAVLALRALIGGDAPPARVATESTLPPTGAPAIDATLLPLPPAEARPVLMLRPARATPEPWTFATLAEAGRQLAYPVVAPTYLTHGLFLQTVRWQLDTPITTPGQMAPGVLLAWFASEETGGVLLLEQGPAVGVSDYAAPEGMSGTLLLNDGRRLWWVRGHRQRLDDAPGGGGWGGTELRVGLRAGTSRGWRLTSRTLTLEELTKIAEGLRPPNP